MSQGSPKAPEKKVDEGVDYSFIPVGVYTRPSSETVLKDRSGQTHKNADGFVVDILPLPNEPHGGYVRIADAKGKFFPCGFSRPIGYVMETVAVSRKRSRESEDGEIGSSCDDVVVDQPEEEMQEQKTTITEERLHPEEALFLHMRGLLRIESDESESGASTKSILSTQDLFCNMLPECNVPLAAYLAYAHLRSQGYILIRHTDQRMELLREMKELEARLEDEFSSQADLPKGTSGGEEFSSTNERIPNKKDLESTTNNGEKENDDHGVRTTWNISRHILFRPLRVKLSDDVASAPPPCVVSLRDGNIGEAKIGLAYYAYNPNACFRRKNPGKPDFGVAVMPYHSSNDNGPTFDILKTLASMCEEDKAPQIDGDMCDPSGDAASGIPLRVVTVADGGAVIAFGITNGDVPSINDKKYND